MILNSEFETIFFFIRTFKLRFQPLFVYDLKLATDDWSDKNFLLTSKLCSLGAVVPLPWAIYIFYNAITQNTCFVKGSYKYDVYLRDKIKAHLNWPNKERDFH